MKIVMKNIAAQCVAHRAITLTLCLIVMATLAGSLAVVSSHPALARLFAASSVQAASAHQGSKNAASPKALGPRLALKAATDRSQAALQLFDFRVPADWLALNYIPSVTLASPFAACDTPTFNYANQSVNVGAPVNLNPTGVTNVTSYALLSSGGYPGTVSVSSSTGAVTISNAQQGTYTITIRATNSTTPAMCSPSTTADDSFTLTVNGPPTFSTVFGITRTAGGSVTPAEPLNVKIVDNLADDITPVGSLAVSVNNGATLPVTVGGVTLNNLTRTGNMYFADIAAGCTASGTVPFTISFTDGAGLVTTQLLNITVLPNSAPVAPTYTSSVLMVNEGDMLTIPRLTPPSDNVSVSVAVGNLGGYNGTISVNNTPGPNFGDVMLAGASPGGSEPQIFITATDNCGLTASSSFKVKINGRPSVAPSSPGVRQGSSPVNQTLANISDPDPLDTVSTLTFSVPTTTVNGVTLSNITKNNTTGELKADIAATCMATTATFTVNVTDSKMLTGTAMVTVNVLPNTPPVLSYPATTTVSAGAPSTTINPLTGPSDNGTISTLAIQTYNNACGALAINTTPGPNYGRLTLTSAPTTGMTCPVTVRATDACGAMTDATLNIRISAPSIGISKTHVPINAMVQPGDVALFQLNFSNTGDQDATMATLTETVPANTTFDATSSSPGWSCANGSPAATPCTYTIGNIGAGGAGSVFFGVRVVNPVNIGVTQVSNQFTYSDSITPSAMSNVDTVPIVAFPDMAVVKTDSGVTSMAGDTVNYLVSYSNVGRRNAAGVIITETVPANTTFNPGLSSAAWTCLPNNNAGSTCTIYAGNVAGGASGSYSFAVDVAPILPVGVFQITNTVSISDASGTDPAPSNNSSTDTTPVGNGLLVTPIAVGITQGSPASNLTIANMTDALAPVSGVTVVTTSVPAGITVSNIINLNGTVTANIAAGCNAALGPNMVGLKATDGAGNMTSVFLTVTVGPNTAPMLGVNAYPATGPINPGTSTAVTPVVTPSDNGSIASIVASAPGFTGAFSVNPTTGVVNVSNAGPSGTYTVTVTATDNCGLTATQTFQLIVNTPPTITPAATLNLTQGSITPNPVATVGDINTPVGSLIVTMESVAPPGVLLSGFMNAAGAITANVAVDCTAAPGNHTVVLKVTDGGGLSTTANLIVNVGANTAPVHGTYSAALVNAGAGTTLTPTVPPSDNGLITGIVASAPGFTGTFSVNPVTGIVTVTNAGPMGVFTVTVTATDNCGLTSSTTFQLTVNCAAITVNLPGTTTGTVSTPFNQTFTQTGGVGAVTYSLASGVLPTGLTLTSGGVLAGTPTQSGTFPITVKATDSNGCMGTSATYNLVIACQTITVNPPASASGSVGTSFSQNFAQVGGIGAVTYSLNTGTIPTGLTLAANGVLSGTPTQSGTFPITVKVTDANGCMGISATYNLVIACPNIAVTPPVVTVGTVNTFFTQNFTQQGSILPATFTLDTGTLPTGLTLSASGTLAGIPTQSGSFPIKVKVTDSNGCTGVSPTYNLVINCQTITVTPPAVTTGTVNAAFSQNFTQTGGTGATTFSLNTGTLPTGVTLSSAGLLAGTPLQTGSFNITVKATDANGCTGISASYTLVIGCQTIAVTPPAVATGTISVAFSESFTQVGGVGATTFSLNSGVLPSGVTLSSAGLLSGTPTQLGSFPITVKATDSNGCMGVSATYTLVIGCQTITVTPPAVTTGTVGTPFSQTFTQTGGNGAVSFSLNSGVLPTGMTLSSAGVLSGTPTQFGTFPLTVKVTDVNGCMGVSATYNLVINCQLITVTPPAVATGTVGVAFSQTFTQSGALGATSYTVNSGTLPPGLTLSLSGTLAGIPTQAGTFPITVKVTDVNGCTGVSATYNLVISCPTIALSPTTLPNGTYGVAYSQTVTGSPAGVYNYTIMSGALPPGLTLNATSGAITGIPTAVGTHNFTIKALYYNNCPFTQSYSIVINCPVVALAPPNLVNGTIGATYTQTVSATPAGVYSFAVTGGALPNGLTLNATTGEISGTPTLIGTYNFTVTATGSGGLNGCTGSKAYTITIVCRTVTVTPPTTLPGGQTGQAYSQTIAATPANTYSFSVSQGSLPPGLTLNPATGLISGTPTQSGSYSFSVTATDPDTCAGTHPYVIVIGCPTITLAPTVLPGGTIGVAYPATNFTAAPAGTYTFAITSGGLPAGLSLTSAGLLSGTPTQSGSFPITVTATNAQQCTGSRSYTIVINLCPSITVDPQTIPQGQAGVAYNQTFSATGGTAPYTFTRTGSSPLPSGLTLSPAGVLSGTPVEGTQGSHTFTVNATDANGCVGTRLYTLVIGTCTVTSLAPTSQSVPGSGGSFTFSVTAPNCGWNATSQAPWLTVTNNGAGTGNLVVSYTVGANPGAARTGVVIVNNLTFTVNQAAGDPKGDVDNDGIPNAVELIEGTNPEVKDNNIFVNSPLGNRLFVMQQYRDFLGREGDAAGITFWVNLLNSNTLTRAQVIESFFNSPEFSNTVAPVTRLYFAAFSRIPDTVGLISWVNAYRSGTPLASIAQTFATSPEFLLTYGSLNNTQYVTLLYNNILGRAPDQAGLNGWVTALNNGTLTRGQVLLGFSESAEFIQTSSNKVFTVMMYIGMLRRSPEQAGFDSWVSFLNTGGSRLSFIQGFINAQEYRNRFLPLP